MHILVTSAGSHLAQRVIQALAPEHDVRATERAPLASGASGRGAAHGRGLATAPGARPQGQAEVALAISPLGHDLSTNLLVRGVDVVIHCAEPLPDETPESYLDYCTRCTYNLLMAASQEGVKRVIYLSTLALMTPYPADYVVTEQWQPLPTTDPLVLGKHLGESVCREFAREFKVPVLALRLGSPSDGADSETALVDDDLAHAIARALEAEAPRWAVVHVQSEFDGARFPVGDAKRLLGFVPGDVSQLAGSEVNE